MIKVVNHLYGEESIKNNFYLSQFKNIVFETDSKNLVKILMLVRISKDLDTLNIKFKYEYIEKLLNYHDKHTMFVSRYQILWDKIYLDNNGFKNYINCELI